ncbi:hypothetical protein [Xenorhabdus cabanillasii]|nr:hypothetical protein [Xenorhabdus cabanillasii]
MGEKKTTRRNIAQLQEDGYFVIDPAWHENFDTSLQRMVGQVANRILAT